MPSQAIRNKAVDGIKQILDKNVIGKCSKERKQIVNRFVKYFRNVNQCQFDFNLYLAFLMCLPDDTFIEFDLRGESCPNLIRLQLVGYINIFFKIEHLLALVLGNKRNLVPLQLFLQLKANQ